MLEFKGDVENTFQRTFSIDTTTITGETFNTDLKENGDSIPVTAENAAGPIFLIFVEFVELYVDFLLSGSISNSFNAFHEGFDMVTSGSALVLFRPEELMMLVRGSPTLDFKDLEKSTKYDGFEAEAQIIR